MVGLGEAVDPLAGGGELDAVAGLQARIASPVARWVLPVPGGPRRTTFSLAATKSSVARWATVSRFRPRAWS